MNARTLALAATALGLAVIPAKADIQSALIGKTIENTQTGPSTVNQAFTFFFSGAYLFNATDYDTGMLTYPGPGSPQTLTPGVLAGGPNLGFQTFGIPLSTLNSDYPFGTYTIQATNTSTSAVSSAVGINYNADGYTSDIPMLTAASFNLFAGGFNPFVSNTINFNSFTPGPGSNQAFLFFYIFPLTPGFAAPFLPPSTTSVTIPAGTLLPGTSYIWDVDFDSRIQSTDINGSGIPTQQLFDVRTFGTFTTLTTPEPASLALLAPVTAFFLLTLKRRRSKKTAGV